MSFDPSLLPPVAYELTAALKLDKEARTRSAIGRAYYSLFLGVRAEACRQLGQSVDNSIEHGRLAEELYRAGANGNAELEAVAKLLTGFYEARRQADYKLEPKPPWDRFLRKPSYADNLAKQASATLLRLSSFDFSALKGRI